MSVTSHPYQGGVTATYVKYEYLTEADILQSKNGLMELYKSGISTEFEMVEKNHSSVIILSIIV